MEKRTYESPMEWEYQGNGPMDPSSPFAQSTKKFQDQNSQSKAATSGFSSYTQNPFARLQSSPSKALTPSSAQQSTSLFSSARGPKASSANPFRNAAFTTPRKPFDIDGLAEISPVESSPAFTEGSDFPETPDPDQSLELSYMAITPASILRQRALMSATRASGRGEIPRTLFPMRDKVRKRKRYNGDRDVSGFRLPYRYPGEGHESEYESDESTFQPNRQDGRPKKKSREEGWFGGFLATIQRHPYAPSILGYWLNFTFSLICMTGTVWIGWTILAGLSEDFAAARSSVRNDIMLEISKCRADYADNKCFPVESRIPAIVPLCEQWFTCMNQNPDNLQKVQLGAKSIVGIINEIVETMSYKTIALLVLLFIIFLFSGRSLYKSANDYPDFTRHAPPAYQPTPSQHVVPQQVYWQAIQPHTPRRQNSRALLANDETPETDASPPQFKTLLASDTPRSWRSPSKRERSRSPTKRY